MKRLIYILPPLIILAAILWIPVGGGAVQESLSPERVPTLDLSSFSAARPGTPLRLLFIHHSCGGQLFADAGPEKGENCIYESYPEGGGLRRLLRAEGYEVREASYGSEVGDRTDIFDWLPKFRDSMEKVLTCKHQDIFDSGGPGNRIVMFKSCYPNNDFIGEENSGEKGDPAGPVLTPANARAAYAALLPVFAAYPETLFVCVTAPPIALRVEAEPLWKILARLLMSKATPAVKQVRAGSLARKFNNWLKSRDGWLKNYTLRNVVVFDYYDILTGEGESNFSRYATENGTDSHPARAGNEKAARAFVPFLNRVVRRAGLVGSEDVR